MSRVLLCLKVFAARANFPVHRSELVDSMRKFNLTTKRTHRLGSGQAPDTKGLDIYTPKLRALRTTIVENFRGLRNFFIVLQYSNKGIDSRQGAKHAKFGGER